MRAIVIVLVVVLSGCGHSSPPARPEPTSAARVPAAAERDAASANDACAHDDECLVTNWSGCCQCPQCTVGEPRARSKVEQRAAEAECAAIDCDMTVCSIAGSCRPGESAVLFTARCRAGTCVGIRN